MKKTFPLSEKHGIEFWALASKEHAGVEPQKVEDALSQLEAELSGLEACCRVLEKALGVPKKASLKQIDERIAYLVKLEKEVALLHDVEVHLTVCENNRKHSVEFGKQKQYTDTINLFNTLRNGRFQFNDEVKMVIDMLKDEMTREVSK
jgi:hypothetical protein